MFCFKIVAVLGMDMHFCDPNQLIATKQRNKLAAANKALCYLTRGSFKEDQHTQASPSEPWSDSLTATPGQRLTVPDSLTALTALSPTV